MALQVQYATNFVSIHQTQVVTNFNSNLHINEKIHMTFTFSIK